MIYREMSNLSPQKSHSKRVLVRGDLLKHVSVFGWLQRYLVLHEDRIVIKMREGFGKVGSFELNRHCIAADSNEREFCFYIKDTSSNSIISLAASDFHTKDIWMESVHSCLARLRQIHLDKKMLSGVSPSNPQGNKNTPFKNKNLKTEKKKLQHTGDKAARNYQNRHMIYLKVVRCCNLLKESLDTEIQVYAKATLGESST